VLILTRRGGESLKIGDEVTVGGTRCGSESRRRGKFQCTARRPKRYTGSGPIRDPAACKVSRRVPDREGLIIPYVRVWVS
jgi:hypothetical protein